MCGIAGIYNSSLKNNIDKPLLGRMIATLKHRGPDDYGFYNSNGIGLAQSRLSIIDIAGGKQPIHNEDKTIWIVFNGEIFNYIELRELLEKNGHRFYTKSDTEVIVHAYEEYGMNFVDHLNGQFAIAIWNERVKELILARDRVGIRPLFYTTLNDGTFLFASEIKAIFTHPQITPEIDPAGINQIFTLWVNIPPKTVFKNICELPAGYTLKISPKGVERRQYWKLSYPGIDEYDQRPIQYYTQRLEELIYDAVTIRLRADVPVASYLSGGIDSSIISALVKKYHNNNLITFSVAFSDKDYDERPYQMEMVNFLNTDHRIIEASYNEIGKVFSDVVRYAEKPMIRTAPAPLYILSGLVRDNNIKVVLTGEGADEVFGGYNIFKEDKIRRFWARHPDSRMRPLLLSALYPYINKNKGQINSFWQLFFKKGLSEINNPFYSHRIRWDNTSQIKRFFRSEYRELFDSQDQLYEELHQYIDPDMQRWHPLCRAQYLEMSLFMSGYLLSSQGDRMMMGHSVEGRFPFLDHHVIEFANTIPPEYKIKVLNEKYILKKTYKNLLPESIVNRPKQPYRAPIYQCFLNNKNKMNDNLAVEMFSPEKIDSFKYFDPKAVNNLVTKMTKAGGKAISARDDMAVVGITSMQLLHHHFIEKKNNCN